MVQAQIELTWSATGALPLPLGTPLYATGSQFRGISEASGSNSAQNSPTDYPLVPLRRLDDDQTRFLLPNPGKHLVEDLLHLRPSNQCLAGHALATVSINRIPKISKIIHSAQPET